VTAVGGGGGEAEDDAGDQGGVIAYRAVIDNRQVTHDAGGYEVKQRPEAVVRELAQVPWKPGAVFHVKAEHQDDEKDDGNQPRGDSGEQNERPTRREQATGVHRGSDRPADEAKHELDTVEET